MFNAGLAARNQRNNTSQQILQHDRKQTQLVGEKAA